MLSFGLASLRRRLREPGSDDGFTLVELLVYTVLLGLVMIVLAGIFVSTTTAQKNVQSVTSASNSAQLASNQISLTINNASAVSVTSPVLGDQYLQARMALPTSPITWVCRAWYFQSATNSSTGSGRLFFKTSSSAIAAPSASALSSWTLVASGVTPVSPATTIFNSPLTISGSMSTTSSIIAYAFYVTATQQQPVLMSSTASTQTSSTVVSSPCF